MSAARRWRDVKAEAHRRHPLVADPERRAAARSELAAYEARYQDEMRDREDTRIAEERIADVRAGRSRLLPADEVARKLDL